MQGVALRLADGEKSMDAKGDGDGSKEKNPQRRYLARTLYEWAVPGSKLPAAKRRHFGRSARDVVYLVLAAYPDLRCIDPEPYQLSLLSMGSYT